MVKLTVNDRKIEAKQGTTLLQACLDHDIYIPNLCHIKGMTYPTALCRMCFVEIEKAAKPVAACTVEVKAGMVVRTDTPTVRQLQRSGLRLLLSVHHVDCKNCPANKKCALQQMAKFLKVGLKPKHLEQYLKEPELVSEHPLLDYYPNRCVLCGKCYYACRTRHGRSVMTFAKRGFDTVISFFGEQDPSALSCEECKACVDICPVGALVMRNSG
ncbi:MAG: (2Fe-2S)-binding protein [Proteobacteria bacterium]|nr:(2Fe-2S)-binding protein [Pseudomonadota bacterium]